LKICNNCTRLQQIVIRPSACRIKDESRRNRLENEAKLFHEKLARVQETRLEKREIERAIVDQRLCDRRAALERKEEVRRALEQGNTARAREEERKRQLSKATYEERIEQERRARLEIEAKLSDMAHIEICLIDQLKDRMEEQQQVRNCSLQDVCKDMQTVMAEVSAEEQCTPITESHHPVDRLHAAGTSNLR
jgi:hypothetical protein